MEQQYRSRVCFLACIASFALSACSTLPNGRGWGQDADFTPSWERVGLAASNAARDPWVWGPLMGAAVFQIDDFDRRTSNWARAHTPVFGSPQRAEAWSNNLRSAAVIADFATLLATPSGTEPEEWLLNKSKGLIVTLGAVGATSVTTHVLKTQLNRERPNGADDLSMPSGHASIAAVSTRMAMEHIDAIDMNATWRRSLDVGLAMVSVGTSWARVESGAHYPSDTLVGMALGNFIASFANDAFLGLQTEKSQVALTTMPDGAMLSWRARF